VGGKVSQRGNKRGDALYKLQGLFGSEMGFRFARMVGGCIEHGRFFKRGDMLASMDKETFDWLVSNKLIKESTTTPGCFFLVG